MKKLFLLSVFMLLSSSFANALYMKSNFTSNQINNLIMGVKSDNAGLKKSCIYFAAKYQVVETVQTLVDEFENNDDPKMKVLIALALYQIGDKSGIEAVYKASLSDGNQKVRKTCFEVMKLFQSDERVLAND